MKKRIQGMKQLLLLAAVALMVASVVGCGPEQFKADTKGSEEMQNKAKAGLPIYSPPKEAMPASARDAGAPGARMPGAPGGTAPVPPR